VRERNALETRFLVLAPTGRDGSLTCSLLARAGLEATACASVEQLCAEARLGAAAILIADEALDPAGTKEILALVATQEPWSDLPIVIFTGEGATIRARHPTIPWLAPLGNVSLLDRPVRPITMLSAARSALRARLRQYHSRDELIREQQEVRQRDQFLAMLGHELRNPLGVILLASEMLERNGNIADLVPKIKRQGRHLARLVDDLLDVARVTSGKIALQIGPVDLNDLVERCVQSVLSVPGRRHKHLRFRRADGPVLVNGDMVRLDQVFVNLVTNAVKYTPADRGIDVSVEIAGGEALVRVTDEGVGIAPGMLAHVFDLFAQADDTLDRSQGGMGIGLTLVRGLVEMHGGAVEAHSAGVGAGSEFVVRLPLRLAIGDEAAAASSTPAGQAPARRVLVIEDNLDTRELLKQLGEALGHTVDVAADGIEGLSRALTLGPDAILVDIGLPGLDGYHVARRLRRSLGEGVLLVALTGYGQPEDQRRALEAGFDHHCTKPIDAQTLQSVLGGPRAKVTT
jgi:signal transduction histidine kinase/CheY-like chemotaxis protein